MKSLTEIMAYFLAIALRRWADKHMVGEYGIEEAIDAFLNYMESEVELTVLQISQLWMFYSECKELGGSTSIGSAPLPEAKVILAAFNLAGISESQVMTVCLCEGVVDQYARLKDLGAGFLKVGG